MQLSAWIREKAADRAIPPSTELSNRIIEYAKHQPILRAAGRSEGFEPLQQALANDHRARIRELWFSTLALLLNGIFIQAFVVVLITVAANLANGGSLAPLETIAIIGLCLRFSRSLEQIGSSYVGLDLGRVAIVETARITETPSLPEPSSPADGDGTGSVELCDVTFGYDDTPVLNEVSFTARPGTVTAIVGTSGSGKTTIARLISRFWDVDSGKVLVDGVDIRRLGTETLMSKLSMVFQDVYLFDDTLIANIRVGRPEATDEEIRQAADLAGATSIANRLGWDTPVGEGGRLLSGGERQRISVAPPAQAGADCAFRRSHLRPGRRKRSQRAGLGGQAPRRIHLHRDCAQAGHDSHRRPIVVVDDNGRVSQQGTHEELYSQPGIYQSFWRRREAARGWTLGG